MACMNLVGVLWKMRSSLPLVPYTIESRGRRLCLYWVLSVATTVSIVFCAGRIYANLEHKELWKWPQIVSATTCRPKSSAGLVNIQPIQGNALKSESILRPIEPNACQNDCQSSGIETLPKGIVRRTSDLEMVPPWGPLEEKATRQSSKNLLAIPVGIKQKETVNQIVNKFLSDKFTVMLFHYDGVVDEWKDLQWSMNALHVSAINQSKWWFAKRFLHPDIVDEYKYIFLWDEDIGVENFLPERYLAIVEREGLQISQPALDPAKSRVHHQITARSIKGDVHRRIYKLKGRTRCYENSTGPPCTGWVEMMAPVFSRAAWRCAWHMIQNDLIHAWGLDMKLGYCAQGDRSQNIGVVDSQYIIHKALPTLGGSDEKVYPGKSTANDRTAVRQRSFTELQIFRSRWQKAMEDDVCWNDPFPENKTNSTT